MREIWCSKMNEVSLIEEVKLVVVNFFLKIIKKDEYKSYEKDKDESYENSPSIIFFGNRVYKCGGMAITINPWGLIKRT